MKTSSNQLKLIIGVQGPKILIFGKLWKAFLKNTGFKIHIKHELSFKIFGDFEWNQPIRVKWGYFLAKITLSYIERNLFHKGLMDTGSPTLFKTNQKMKYLKKNLSFQNIQVSCW